MEKLKRLNKYALCSILFLVMLIQTSCLNSKITAASSSISMNVLSSGDGQTVDTGKENDDDSIMLLEKKERLINIEANSSENENSSNELENQIIAYLGNNINSIGLSYFDINSGQEIIINGDKTFLAASTVKVQMNMVLGDLIENGEINENESLQFTEDSYEDGTGILQYQDLSKPISLSLLSDYSIIYSDNIATNMIIKRIDYYKMRNLIDAKLGHATDSSGNYITANDETELLKLLYANANNNSFYTKLIKNMEHTDFHDRIDLYLPHSIVAHKVGNYDSYVNDVGIIYSENPYILSIYTNELNNANEVIAHISKMIYDYQEQQSK